MDTTTTNAVETKGNVFSSFINYLLDTKNWFVMVSTMTMTGVLIEEIYNKFQQPVDIKSLIIYAIYATLTIFSAWFIANEFKTLSATMLSAMVAVVFSTSIASAIIDSQRASAEIRTLTTTILFVIFFFLTDRLWVMGRRYFPAYILFLMSILVAIQK